MLEMFVGRQMYLHYSLYGIHRVFPVVRMGWYSAMPTGKMLMIHLKAKFGGETITQVWKEWLEEEAWSYS